MKSKKNIKSIITTFIIVTMTTLFINISLAGDTVKVTVETANLRKEATLESNILEQISIGETVEILEQHGDWYKVTYKGITGYLRNDLIEVPETLKVTEPEPQVETPEVEEPKVEEQQKPEVVAPETTEETKYKIKEDTKLNIIPSINAIEIGEAKKDEEITILERLNGWICIENGMGKGWLREEKIEEIKPEIQEPVVVEPVVEPKVMYVNSSSVNVREGATTESNIVANVLVNTEIKVYENVNGWSKVEVTSSGAKGYISSSLLSSTKQDTSRNVSTVRTTTTTQVPVQTPAPVVNNVASSSKGSQIVGTAQGYVGCNYVYGGTTPSGFDCSGFTQYVFRACGINLNRTAAAQTSNGVAVSRANLEPGDLIMFGKSGISHVAIYIGGGQIVHAANSRQGVRIDSINSGYYNNNYACARRVF